MGILICILLLVLGLLSVYYLANKSEAVSSNFVEYDLKDTDSIKDYKLEELKEFNNGLNVIVNYDNNNFKYLEGKYTDRVINNDEDIIYSLYNIKSIMGTTNPAKEFQFVSKEAVGKEYVYKFKQINNGRSVIGNEIIVSVKDNNPYNIVGRYTPIDDSRIKYSVNINEALNIVQKQSSGMGNNYKYEKVIYIYNDGSYSGAWSIEINNKFDKTKDKVVYINAETGKIIKEIPLYNTK